MVVLPTDKHKKFLKSVFKTAVFRFDSFSITKTFKNGKKLCFCGEH